MKKTISLALAALLVAALSSAVSAEAVSTDIKNGTPVLDGQLDEIYTQSASYKLDNFAFYSWGDGDEDNHSDATTYFLWDDNYLYVCTVAQDSTPGSNADAGWQNDAAEMWFNDEDLVFKIHAAADGTFFLGGDRDGAVAWKKGFEASQSKATRTKDGWVVECAFPMNDLKAGKEFGFSLQVNDIYSDDYAAAGVASGSQGGEGATMKLVADKVEAPKTDVKTDDGAASADTFDMGAAAAIAAIVSAAGYAIAKKQ